MSVMLTEQDPVIAFQLGERCVHLIDADKYGIKWSIDVVSMSYELFFCQVQVL